MCVFIVHVCNSVKILSKNAKVEIEKMKYYIREDNN